MELKVVNMAGKQTGTIKVSDEIFNAEYNSALIHQVVVSQLNNQRQGTFSAKTRAEVSGGGIKPFRQKGTGHARQGSTRSPNHVHGGIVFAKKPRSFATKVNKAMKNSAFLSALSEKIRQNEVVVLDSFDLSAAKTKEVANCVKALKLEGRTEFVLAAYDADALLATRNMPEVSVAEMRTLSVYEVVSTKNLVIEQEALKQLEEGYND